MTPSPPPTPAAAPAPPAFPLSAGKSRVWTAFLAFFVALAWMLVIPAVVIGPVVALRYGPDALRPENLDSPGVYLVDPWVFLPVIASIQVGFAAVALTGAALSPMPWRHRLRLGPSRLPWHAQAVAVVGMLSLSLAGWKLLELFGLYDRGAFRMFSDVLGGLRGGRLAAAALVIGLAPGLGEEMLFRGYLQTRLTRRWGRVVSLAVTSVLFGVMHLDWVQGSVVVLMGLYLGALSESAGSIRPAVACHALNNATAALVLSAPRRTTLPESLAIVAIAVVVLIACTTYWVKSTHRPERRSGAP